MKTFGSISVTSNRSCDNSAIETVDEIESSEPSSGYCSADDEHTFQNLRTPTESGSIYDRRLSESSSSSSGGVSSKLLLSLSLSEALSLTLCESPPPSPTLDEVLPDKVSPSSRSPASSVVCDSFSCSVVHTPPVDELPGIGSSRPVVKSVDRRVEPSINISSNFEILTGVEIRPNTMVTSQRLTSQNNRTDLHSTEAKLIQELSDGSDSHRKSNPRHASCQENDDLSYPARSQTTDGSNSSSGSGPMGENTIPGKSREEKRGLSEDLLTLPFDGSVFKEGVANNDEVYLVIADGSLKKLLPLPEMQLCSSIKQEVLSTLPHRLPVVPRIEPRKSFNASFPEHSTGFGDKTDQPWCNSDVFNHKFCATDCHNSPRFAVATDSMGPTASLGSTISTVSTVPTGSKDYAGSTSFMAAVGFFHSYAVVTKTSDSCHSVTNNNWQLQGLSFSCHGAGKEHSYDAMVQTNPPKATTTLLADRSYLGEDCASILTTTAIELQQETAEHKEVSDEFPKSGSGTSSPDNSFVQKTVPKRSKSSYRQNPKRRFRSANPALAELEDHGYSLGVACRPASPRSPASRPCPTAGEEMASTADASSVLAKLLLTRERLIPNEGSDGFIARSGHPGHDNNKRSVRMSGQSMSGTLLEKLLTGEVDQAEIQRSEDRIIRDRLPAGTDDRNDIDLELPDFDPGCLELENLEELWNNYGGLEIFSRDVEELMRLEEETSFRL